VRIRKKGLTSVKNYYPSGLWRYALTIRADVTWILSHIDGLPPHTALALTIYLFENNYVYLVQRRLHDLDIYTGKKSGVIYEGALHSRREYVHFLKHLHEGRLWVPRVLSQI
jgi:hypothetical protein